MPTIIDYQAEIGWKIDWQDAAPLPGADPVFMDNSLPNRGLNRKASNYSGVNDYELHAVIDAVVSQDGINTTYRAISPVSKANNYDVPSVDPRDFDCVITIHDADTDANIGAFLPNKSVIMRATYSLVNGGNIADYADAWGIHRIEVNGNTGYNIYEFTSERANLTGTPLTSASGLLSVTYDGDDIITECLIDGTLLSPGTRYKVSSRLGLPNVFYTPPVAELTNIVADTETGFTAFDLNLTPGVGVFDVADTLELNVYNNADDTLLYTLTGNYGSDISTFTGAISGYLSGTISTASGLAFDKLQWAIAEDLINTGAVALRFEFTITQTAIGLTSNTASGVFSVELQDAEYIGDLRYFDNDGRKLYTSNANGSNTVAVALDLTLKYSQEIFDLQNGVSITSLRVIEDSDFGTPWSKLLVSESDVGTNPYQWVSEANTADGEAWTFASLKNNLAGAGSTLNFPIKDDLRTANGQPVYWVGMDLPIPNVLYMLYYDGAAWQAVDFSAKISGLLISAVVRVAACISFTGDIYGFACANGTTGEKRIFRMLQTSGTKTTVADFINPANWANATVMAGGGSAGTTDANGTSARFANPYGMVMITDDGTRPIEIWVADGNNCSIRKLEYAAGTDNYDVTTVIGLSGTSGDTNGTGTAARLGDVRGITKAGTSVYIGDLGNRKIKKVVISNLAVTTFSGTGANSYRVATLY